MPRPLAPLLFAGVVSAGALSAVAAIAGVRLNWTDSIPPGLYWSTSAPVTRGAITLLCLPESVARFGRRRGYLPPGPCVEHVLPVGKPVAAVAGDTVDVTGAGIRVNGRVLPNSRARAVDGHGRDLPRQAHGRTLVPPGMLVLVSSASPGSAGSFDSRYYGAVPATAVRAVLHPLWTW